LQRLDQECIFIKLNEMIRYVQELQEMLPEKEEYLHDLIKRRACEKTVEVAIESLIDVSAMIVSAQKLGLPSNEENIFDILIENGILTQELGERLKDLKGFRLQDPAGYLQSGLLQISLRITETGCGGGDH
jgi:uncharacterized protein YutE (UPF0331/DUF86 family)